MLTTARLITLVSFCPLGSFLVVGRSGNLQNGLVIATLNGHVLFDLIFYKFERLGKHGLIGIKQTYPMIATTKTVILPENEKQVILRGFAPVSFYPTNPNRPLTKLHQANQPLIVNLLMDSAFAYNQSDG